MLLVQLSEVQKGDKKGIKVGAKKLKLLENVDVFEGGVLSSPSPTSGALSASATHVAFTGATALRARVCRAKLVGRNTLSVAFCASAVTDAEETRQK